MGQHAREEAGFGDRLRHGVVSPPAAIGVSRVEIPTEGKGAPGANIPTVPLDTSGWEVASVSEAKPSKNGFWGGGESQKEKDALINRKAEAPFNRMLAGRTGGAPALTTP